jgi:hypothetical protein
MGSSGRFLKFRFSGSYRKPERTGMELRPKPEGTGTKTERKPEYNRNGAGMNGREQVEQYSKLWQPDQIGGIRIGDAVRLPSIEATFEVIGIADPLLILRAPSGREVRAGWQAVRRVPKC